MVNYVKGPAYKTLKSVLGLNAPVVKSYIPNLVFWGGSAAGAVATFTEGIPLFKDTFYTKIPYFGQHWVYNPDPEDIPL